MNFNKDKKKKKDGEIEEMKYESDGLKVPLFPKDSTYLPLFIV